MKKTSLLFLVFIGLATMANAQKGKVSSATNYLMTNDLTAAKEAIDEAIGNEKTSSWPKTYIVAAKIYSQLAKSGKDDQGVEKSAEYFKKAIALDKAGDAQGKGANKFSKEIKLAMLNPYTDPLYEYAANTFGEKKFDRSLAAFETILWANSTQDGYNEVNDTLTIYNAALAAFLASEFAKAETYFDKSITYKYGGPNTILFQHEVLKEMKDSAKIENNLKRGFELYPEDKGILTNLIQYYLTTQQNKAALEYLNTAIDKDPANPSFYYARGVLNESLNKEESVKDYEKSLEIDPKFFNSLYNLAVVYFNNGVSKVNDASGLRNDADYNKAIAESNDWFKKALPYMETAYEVSPKEPAVLESLKGLYYRFGMMDKYNEFSEKLNELKK